VSKEPGPQAKGDGHWLQIRTDLLFGFWQLVAELAARLDDYSVRNIIQDNINQFKRDLHAQLAVAFADEWVVDTAICTEGGLVVVGGEEERWWRVGVW
jgi:hypothetical protein